jgi:hypothetical protein
MYSIVRVFLPFSSPLSFSVITRKAQRAGRDQHEPTLPTVAVAAPPFASTGVPAKKPRNSRRTNRRIGSITGRALITQLDAKVLVASKYVPGV